MPYTIKAPTSLNATVSLPASKSISNRVLIIHALSRSDAPLYNLSDCDDTQVMLSALTADRERVDIKAAGTAMRFLTAYYAITPGVHILTGTDRMKKRPIRLLVDALRSLGADIAYLEEEGFPPLKITGADLQGGEVELDGSVSSQYLSALLMIAPVMRQGLRLKIKGVLISRPYLQLTLSVMRDFGIESRWEGDTVCIDPQAYLPRSYTVESDWSAASYWYEMAALSASSQITLEGLYRNSCQGDARLVEIFRQLGVSTRYTDQGVVLRKERDRSKRFIFNFVDQPDLAQTFAVTSALLNIPFRFAGLQSLKIKETDRMVALITELGKWGYCLQESNGSLLEWNGERCEECDSVAIDTYEDHRMALSFAPGALVKGEVTINDPQVVSKSYPHYWDDLRKAGFVITETE